MRPYSEEIRSSLKRVSTDWCSLSLVCISSTWQDAAFRQISFSAMTEWTTFLIINSLTSNIMNTVCCSLLKTEDPIILNTEDSSLRLKKSLYGFTSEWVVDKWLHFICGVICWKISSFHSSHRPTGYLTILSLWRRKFLKEKEKEMVWKKRMNNLWWRDEGKYKCKMYTKRGHNG